MKKIEERFREIREFCQANANPEFVKKYSRYFTEEYDAYGIDPKIYESQRDDWMEKWKDTCGRTIVQYATEKMDNGNKERFRREKR